MSETKPKLLHAQKLKLQLLHAARYWELNPYSAVFKSGICLALSELNPSLKLNQSPYITVPRLLTLAEATWGNNFMYLPNDGWEDGQRAMMCLFLAEWIETDFESASKKKKDR